MKQAEPKANPELLAFCYANSLKLAMENDLRSVAFPAISCGVYGYPLERAAVVALSSVVDTLKKGASIDRIVFALFGAEALACYQATAAELGG